MSGKTARERLYARRTFGVKLGLDFEQSLLEALGNPQDSVAAIHVAGTNGKGSVCAMLESVLRRAGYRTGLYTSPHLYRFNERFRIGGDCVGDTALDRAVAEVETAADVVGERLEREGTFFECSTAVAFLLFRDHNVQLAVVETGLGGRLDATNVVTPLVSVITHLALEHTAYLGDSLEAIACEKGGIFKPGRPVVCAAMDEGPLRVLRRLAAERGCPFLYAPECVSVRCAEQEPRGQKVVYETVDGAGGTVRLPLVGRHQLDNLAAVLTTLDTLRGQLRLPVPDTSVKQGLASVSWPGRCQLVEASPPLLLDGAHNPDAAAELARTLSSLLGKRPLALVVGMCGDKDLPGFLRPFAGRVHALWGVRLNNERGVSPATLARAAVAAGIRTVHEGGHAVEALREARAWAVANDGAVCATGSLFLVGELLEHLDANGGQV